MWNYEQLLTFKYAAFYKSFTKTADKLNISAAAVGKQIQKLEESLGAQLFYRTTRRVTLTELGKVFYPQCEHILSELAKAKDLIDGYQGKVTGRLKIVSSISFGEVYIIPILASLMQRFPELILDIELADRIPDIESEDIDIVIGLMGGLPAHCMCKKLKDEAYLLCASPQYLLTHGIPLAPEDLYEHNYIAHSKRPRATELIFNKETIIEVKPKLWLNDTHAMLQSCLKGIGISLFFAGTVQEYLAANTLIELLKPYRQPAKPIYVYFKKLHYMQPKVRAFIDFISTSLKN
jgi:DNA-binding transcriptional LysR family regulator